MLFAYNMGPGVINSYLALSVDGTKVAFNENNGASSFFHVLKWATGAGNGTSAAAAVKPGTGNAAGRRQTRVNGGTSTAPFIDYDADVAYVTTSDNVVHKFSGVFLGTPTEVKTAGSGWPVATGLAGGISTPVFDGMSRHVFFTDSDNGGIDYIDDSVVPAVAVTNKFFFAPGLSTAAPVIVDMTNQKVYGFSSNPSGSFAVVGQADTNLSAASQVTVNVGRSDIEPSALMGDFTEDYYNGNAGTALLYVVGNNATANRVPALCAIGFNASFKLNASASFGPLALARNFANINASPVTAFFNTRLEQAVPVHQRDQSVQHDDRRRVHSIHRRHHRISYGHLDQRRRPGGNRRHGRNQHRQRQRQPWCIERLLHDPDWKDGREGHPGRLAMIRDGL